LKHFQLEERILQVDQLKNASKHLQHHVDRTPCHIYNEHEVYKIKSEIITHSFPSVQFKESHSHYTSYITHLIYICIYRAEQQNITKKVLYQAESHEVYSRHRSSNEKKKGKILRNGHYRDIRCKLLSLVSF